MNENRNESRYEMIPHREGYIVKLTIRAGNCLYRDDAPLWLRSKKHMRPITQKECSKIISKHVADDRQSRNLLR